ncbi:MAG: tetratricopeptide repeat protein [Verrucomicrobia bacterium]|nr:tetratricopeptide repeat protein [Verrucomicrobiota bacterium]
MPESRTCSRCGAELPSDAPGGHCLQCLLQLGLAAQEKTAQFGVPPSGGQSEEPAKAGTPSAVTTPLLAEKPGDRIGHYKLLQQIGEGGCGIVYMAEQEEPVRRRVALKIIKLGMDTRNVIARFEAERQALAIMDHPNIAKVLDAGSTERPLTRPSDTLSPAGGEGRGEGAVHSQLSTPNSQLSAGRPYFVMELVRGVKITSYCDQQKLSTRQRLDLFIPVCQAIQHAHQKGIIHRDLKPSNILVTEQDGAPMPKVIDFGIAKATTDQRLTDKTLFTAFEQFLGTPAYMSPEQAGLGGLDIDTRSDIYSLGVLLYELLTGHPPFDLEGLRRSALDEILRVIRENEPPRPSTRLTTLTEQELTTVAQRRQIESAKLPNLLRGDLDWIVMKALEKDRARRYESANGLAMDIQRHLANEPVVARPPSAAYRFQKLVRRNKIAVAATSAVAAALIIGLGVSTWMFLKEKADRQRALASEQRAETVSQFLKDMLKGVGPSVALGRDTKMLQEILDKTAERVGKDLVSQPEVEAELLSTIGTAYFDSGDYPKAKAMYEQALKLSETLFGGTNASVAASLHGLGRVLHEQHELAEAETVKGRALAIRRAVFTNDHPDVAESLISLSDTLQFGGRVVEAEKPAREGLEMWRRLRGRATPDRDVATALNALGTVLSKLDKLAEAESVQREALAMWRQLGEKESPALATALIRLTGVLDVEGKWVEAEELHTQALAMRRKVLGDNHPLVASSFASLAKMFLHHGKPQEAEQMVRDDLANRRRSPPDERMAASLDLLRLILRLEGKPADAEAALREALGIRAGAAGAGNAVAINDLAWDLATSEDPSLRDGQRAVAFAEKAVAATDRKDPRLLDTLAAAYAEFGDFSKAVSAQQEAIALLLSEKEKADYLARVKLYQANVPYRESRTDPYASELASFTTGLLQREKFVEAERPARECLAIREKTQPDSWLTFNARSLLGGTLLGQKKYAEAELFLVSGYAGMKQREDKIPAIGKPRLKETLQRLVQLYEATGQSDKVTEWKQKLTELQKTEK